MINKIKLLIQELKAENEERAKAMKKIFLLLLLTLTISCQTLVNETDVILAIQKSYNPEKGKFMISTTSYCFYTNNVYSVGDTIKISEFK